MAYTDVVSFSWRPPASQVASRSSWVRADRQHRSLDFRWINRFASLSRQRRPNAARPSRAPKQSSVRDAGVPWPRSSAGPRSCPSCISAATAVTWRRWPAP